MNVVDGLARDLRSAGLRLRKASPRGDGRLVLEVDGRDGQVGAGQWHADRAETTRVAALMHHRFGGDSVEVLAAGRLLVQHGGADRKLSSLHRLVSRPGAHLVAHRPERRAVVRLDDHYVKAVRPGRTDAVTVPLRAIRPQGVRVPEVLDADDQRGLVALRTLSGRTLLDLLSDRSLDDEGVAEEARRTGLAVRRLHAHGTAATLPLHDGVSEAAAAERWLAAASAYGLLDTDHWRPRLDRVRAALSGLPTGLVLLHRDLHDKQVVIAPGEPIGLLDLDLAAYGDPVVDLANLLVHLDLRARQGVCSASRARASATALVEGYSPDPASWRLLDAYAACTRLRLAGIYSFRDSPPGLVEALIDDHAQSLVPVSH